MGFCFVLFLGVCLFLCVFLFSFVFGFGFFLGGGVATEKYN